MKPRIVQTERRRSANGEQVRHRAAKYSALILIDRSFAVKSFFVDSRHGDDEGRYLRDGGTRLLPEIESAVATLVSGRDQRDGLDAQVILLDEDRAMRLSPLSSEGDGMFALVIEADRNADYIARAVRRYGLTNRQVDVLLLVLEGANAADVARILGISEYTAQGYIKRLLAKTESKNRTAMVVKILDWSAALPGREPKPPQQTHGVR